MGHEAFKHKGLAVAALMAAAVMPHSAYAEIISYDVRNPGGPGSNGLTMGGGAGISNPYWSFQPGSTFTLDTDAGTGTLSATLINNLGVLSPLELEFSGFLDTLDGTNFYYVRGQGAPRNPATQDYFTDASGTFDYQPFGEPFRINPDDSVTGRSVVQFGEGANYVDPTQFGLAAWLQFVNPLTGVSSNWDISLDLHRRPTDVPEPAPLALLALGLAGLFYGRRRQRKTAVA